MDRHSQTPQTPAQGDPATDAGPDPQPRPASETQTGTALIAGTALVQTVRHFFPDLNDWLEALPDRRDPQAITYPTRFMAWWGIALYLFQLGSRRQLDFDLESLGTHVLENFNRLADTEQSTRPVHDTLDYFIYANSAPGLAKVRLQMVRRLLRMKALDPAMLLGYRVLLVDGTGLLCFHKRHCAHCLVQRHEKTTLYLHQMLEAKLLGPAGVVLSVGSEPIDNSDRQAAAAQGKSAEELKQDCELKAFSRLAPRLKKDFPQTRFVLAGDSLFACGRVLQLARDHGWSYVLTFKPGRLKSVWTDFRALVPLCPEHVLERVLPDGTHQLYRWVHDLGYTDEQNRRWCFNGIECVETPPRGPATQYAWITDLPASKTTVELIAQKGGRYRWKIENEGFNRQKNSGLNLEHVFSIDPTKWQAYYLLLQIAFILVQLLERGSLLRRLAAEASAGRKLLQLFGSLKNIARRLLESVRYFRWPQESFDAEAAGRLHISLDTG